MADTPSDNDSDKLVSVDKIKTTALPDAVPDEPRTPGQNPFTGQNDFPHELGIIGRIVGGRNEKAGNVAAIVIGVVAILLIILLIGWMAHDGEKPFPAGDTFAPLLGLLGTAMGYMFGKGGKNGD